MTGDRAERFDYPSGFERGTALRKMHERDVEAQMEADERLTDPRVDPDGNELHAGAGRMCPVCGRLIRVGQATRKTVSGGYQHDSC